MSVLNDALVVEILRVRLVVVLSIDDNNVVLKEVFVAILAAILVGTVVALAPPELEMIGVVGFNPGMGWHVPNKDGRPVPIIFGLHSRWGEHGHSYADNLVVQLSFSLPKGLQMVSVKRNGSRAQQ